MSFENQRAGSSRSESDASSALLEDSWISSRSTPELSAVSVGYPDVSEPEIDTDLRTPEERRVDHITGILREFRVFSVDDVHHAWAELTRAAGDHSPAIRIAVASHRLTPPTVLNQLGSDQDANVRGAVARNDRTAVATLTRLAGDQDPGVRRMVAYYGNADHQLLLAGDPDRDVRAAIAQRFQPSAAALTRLASDQDVHIRLLVAGHHWVPSAVLDLLANDQDQSVRNLAADGLRRRPRRE